MKANKELDKIFNYAPIKALKMSDEEKTKWATIATQIYKQDKECADLPNDKCVNEGFIHTTLVRDTRTGQIVLRASDCPKHRLFENYVIREFASNLLGLSLLNNKNSYAIEDVREEKVNKYYLDSIKNNKPVGLYFYGSVGIGKTYKTISYCNDMILKNNSKVAYIFVPRLLREMKDNFDKSSAFNKKIIEDCCKADILVLDDFGAEYSSAWFYLDVMMVIFNYRCEADKPTIIVSNYTIDKLAKMLKSAVKSSGDRTLDLETQKIMVDRIIDRIYQLVQNKSITFEGKSRRR